MISILIITKENISVKTVRGISVFVLSTRRIMVNICTKFCGKFLNGFRVMERTRFVTDRQTELKADRWTEDIFENVSPEGSGGKHK